MDRSYNPFGSSQAPAAPAGGVSGGVISSGTVGTGGVGAGGVGVPMGSGVISSGTGDVVLAPSGSGKSKKPWIIAGIVAAVVAVASAVAAVVVMNGSKKLAESGFSRFANYVLYENESDTMIPGDYDANSKYAIDNTFEGWSIEKTTSFYDRAMTLWSDFKKAYVVTDDTENIYNTISDSLAFLKVFFSVQVPDKNELKNIYDEKGRDGVLSVMNSYMSAFYDLPKTVFDEYLDLAQFYTENAISMMRFEAENGVGNVEYAVNFGNSQNDLFNYARGLVTKLSKACFDMNNKINGEKG